ncbi:MAG: hypothetical protein ACSLFP_12400 [Acidimicrobiales bacterium]
MTRRLLLLSVVLLAFWPRPAAAQSTDAIELEAELAGRDIADADSSDPITIEPREEIPLVLTIRNNSDDTESVRYVRLEGNALGLTFLTYDLGIRTTLEPGEQTTLDTTLDFFDLESQATGYLGTSLRVYDVDRRLLGSEGFVVDVRGNATSTLGLFAVVVLGVAVFSVTVLVLNTLRRRLPSNRFVRGVQFAIAGAAIGVTLSLGLSILRITFADVEQWVPLVFIPTVIAFVIGYIAPGPLQRSIRDVREEEALQVVAETAVARASGIYDPATSGGFTPGGRSSGPAAVPHASGKHASIPRTSSEHAPPEAPTAEEADSTE